MLTSLKHKVGLVLGALKLELRNTFVYFSILKN